MTEEANQPDFSRRHFLVIATATLGGATVVGTAIPFLESWRPSAKARALGGPVEVDLSKLEDGAMMKVEWRGQPMYIVHRSAGMLHALDNHDSRLKDPKSNDREQQPPYARNMFRSIEPIFLVVVGVCTHLGCAPMSRFQIGDPELGADWPGGFYCPCHGSKFDLSGRVFKNVPAPTNLKVPPYHFLSKFRVLIGAGPQ